MLSASSSAAARRMLLSQSSRSCRHVGLQQNPPVSSRLTMGARRVKSTTSTQSSASSSSSSAASSNSSVPLALVWGVAAASFGVGAVAASSNSTTRRSYCEQAPMLMEFMTKEPATGIVFPQMCNGMTLAGCGVRYKYGLVKVYAVGTYVDVVAVQPLKTQSKEQLTETLATDTTALPRTIRIVMNRKLTADKFTSAIVEALEPRMKGQELEKLEEFKKLNPPIDLEKDSEMEMTIRGNTLLYRNAMGAMGSITSQVFCQAMCDVFYGAQAVSPSHRDAVIQGIQGM